MSNNADEGKEITQASNGVLATEPHIKFSAPNVSTQIDYQIKDWVIKVGAFVVGVVIVAAIGAISAIVWDLHGKIYETVGKSQTMDKVREMDKENVVLKVEIDKLKNSISCYKNEAIKDKAVCNYGN